MNEIIKVAYHGDWCEDSTFNEYNIDEIFKQLHEFDWLVYSYGWCSCEGDGNMIHKKDGKYFLTNLGHCSCHGPLDDISKVPYDSLEALVNSCSDNLKNEIKDILTAITINKLL